MAYDFNGSNQSLSIGSAPVTAVPLTLACWFYPNTATVNSVLFQINDGNTTNRFGMAALGAVAGDPLRAYTQAGGAPQEIDATASFSAAAWQHACAVFSATNSRTVYLNAANSATNTQSATPTGINKTEIGFRTFDGVTGLFFAGKLAEIGIWDAALTAAEIASLAKGMSCDKVRPQSLKFYAPLVRNLQDVRGGLTITNNNSATVAAHPRVYA